MCHFISLCFVLSLIDNDDNRFGDFPPVNNSLLAPTSESDDKDNDFLESVETQIFPQGCYNNRSNL